MKVIRIVLFLFIYPYLMTGQIKNNDLNSYSYGEISDLFFQNEKNSVNQLFYANLYLKKAVFEKKYIEIAVAYDYYSMIYTESDKQKALYYLDKSIEYSKGKEDSFYPMNSYWNKAALLIDQNKIDDAIDNYKKAEELALKNNSDFYYAIKLNIGKIKSEHLGEVKEAIEIYKECHNFYKKKENKKSYPSFYRMTLFSMADAYRTLKQTDSATYYNRSGYIDSKKNKDEYYKNFFILNEGANLIIKKEYTTALDSINKAFPYIQKNADILNQMACFYYYGKAYEGNGDIQEAVINFTKVDSIYQKNKKITPEIVLGYPFLIQYYKNKGLKEKQLYFTTTYLEIENDFQKKYKHFYNSIIKNYEIPNLIKEENSKLDSLTLLYRIVIACLFFMSLFAVYQYYRSRIYKSRFKKIIQESELWNKDQPKLLGIKEKKSLATDSVDLINETDVFKSNDNQSLNSTDTKETNNNLTIITKELINELLEKLNAFESEKHYLQSGITIQNLSKEFGTNVKYLSKVVNHYKGKAFIHYVNDLRIEYTIIQLQENKLLRQYTIESLAREFGFHSKDSFSNAFYKKTGMKPVYFVQQLIKQSL